MPTVASVAPTSPLSIPLAGVPLIQCGRRQFGRSSRGVLFPTEDGAISLNFFQAEGINLSTLQVSKCQPLADGNSFEVVKSIRWNFIASACRRRDNGMGSVCKNRYCTLSGGCPTEGFITNLTQAMSPTTLRRSESTLSVSSRTLRLRNPGIKTHTPERQQEGLSGCKIC
jgi:hypothetical protein